tara:strand:+ start:1006 stop:1326 length:321 start_codon:yes stop_codon:yes gene_type:complete
MDIRQARINAGFSQEKFAATISVGQQAISDWETGKTCPLDATRKQAEHVLGRKLTFPKATRFSTVVVRDNPRSPLQSQAFQVTRMQLDIKRLKRALKAAQATKAVA